MPCQLCTPTHTHTPPTHAHGNTRSQGTPAHPHPRIFAWPRFVVLGPKGAVASACRAFGEGGPHMQ